MGACSSGCLAFLDISSEKGWTDPEGSSTLMYAPLKHANCSKASSSSSTLADRQSEDGKAQVTVTSLAGGLIASLPFRANEMAVELKSRIEKVDGTSAKSQKLIQGRRLLADSDEVHIREPVTLVRMQRRMAISAGSDRAIRFHDLETGEQLKVIRGTTHISCLAVDWQYLRCFSGGADMAVRVWDLRSGQCLHMLTGHTGWVCALYPDPEDERLVSICQEGLLKLWSLSDGIEQSSIQTPKSKDMQVSVNWAHMLVMVANDVCATVYELASGMSQYSLSTAATLIDFHWPTDSVTGRALFLVPLDFSINDIESQGAMQLWNVSDSCSMEHEFGRGCAWVACVNWERERVVVAVGRPTRYWWSAGTFRKLQAVGLQLWSLSSLQLLQTLGNGLFDAPRSLNVDWEMSKPSAMTCHEDGLLGDPIRFMHWDFEAETARIVKVGAGVSALNGIVAVVVKP